MNPANLPVVATLALLRLVPVLGGPQYPVIYLEGFSTPGDGGQGVWNWSASSSATDNIGTIINPTGNGGNGRWLRQFTGPVIDLWFGVKGDGTTDNHTALQAAEDCANSLNTSVYYPSTTSARKTTVTINTYPGVKHYGDEMNVNTTLGAAVTVGPCNILYTGTGSAYLYQTPLGNVSVPAPSWRDMNITCTGTNGIGIKLNDPANGFTDDPSSQGAQIACNIDRVCFYIGGTNTNSAAVNWSKVFNSRISGCFCIAGDYFIRAFGCDNIEIFQNNAFGATKSEIKTTVENTFMNMTWIRDNVFTGLSPGASGHLDIASNSMFITGNWFENTSVAAFNVKASVSQTAYIEDNATFDNLVTNWLVLNGSGAFLKVANNGPSTTGVIVNAGAGWPAYWNTNTLALIAGGSNSSDLTNGMPFYTNTNTGVALSNQISLPPVVGQPYWRITASNTPCLAQLYNYQSVLMAFGSYRLPALAGNGSRLSFTAPNVPLSITDTVDIWVQAVATINGQVLTLIQGATTTTQALTTSPAWYKMSSAVAVVGLTAVDILNADTVTGGIAAVSQIVVMKH